MKNKQIHIGINTSVLLLRYIFLCFSYEKFYEIKVQISCKLINFDLFDYYVKDIYFLYVENKKIAWHRLLYRNIYNSL